jgi:hypothetical protein
MKRLLWYASCCWTLSLVSAAATYANPEPTVGKDTVTGNAASLGRLSLSDDNTTIATPVVVRGILAQTPPPPPAPTDTPTTPPAPTTPTNTPATTPTAPSNTDSKDVQEQLNQINNNQTTGGDKFNTYQPKTSPAFSIFNPVGFGADKNLFFFSVDYQSRTRFSQTSDGEAGFGVGLGDAVNSVGVELSYSINSFGSSAGFGSGAFNAKVHKRIAEDTAVAIGWNQFAKTQFGGGRNGNGPSDYPNNSYYAVGTKIFRITDDINQPFSRLAVTGGVGSGVFLPFDPGGNLNRTGLNVFGSLGVRVARPVSAIVEWTGQDLGAGISVAPFDNFPLVITPAVRDITGAGDGARFILGASVAFNF